MSFKTLFSSFVSLGIVFAGAAHAGPYAPAAGQPGSTAISASSPSFAQWATGYLDYQPGINVSGGFKTPNRALGTATGAATDVVVLGDGGSITLTFGGSIYDGPGADFAVFENSFSDTFLELAWVEVSSDGSSFFRFPGFSFTPNPVGSFGTVDPTNIDGLAGKYRAGFGTPFDLALLGGVPGLNVDDVRFVRIVDILGDGSVLDSLLRPIYDPTPTQISGGFDLDAVGALYFTATPVPEPSTLALLIAGTLLLPIVIRRRIRVLCGAAAVCLAVSVSLGRVEAAPVVSTFDDLVLAPESHYFPAAATTFSSGAGTFNHDYIDFGIEGCCWDGWTYSNHTDTTTPGFTNQYSAYAGSGAGGSASYGIAFMGAPTVTFATPVFVSGASFTNTTYAAVSMLAGDSFAKKFGGASGNDPDFFQLRILGKDGAGGTTGFVDFFLADYRFGDNGLDHIVDDWTFVDLSGLGAVSSLGFELFSSDVGPFGINTPSYFALDDLTVTAVPEPASVLMLAAGLALLGFAYRGRKS